MNDTHGVEGEGWYGFDLDGTLAVYDKWEGIDHIGEPVKPMVDLVKRMHADGKVVKILTARVAPRSNIEMKPNPYPAIGGGYCVPAYADEYHARALEGGVVCESALVFYKKAEWDAHDFISDWCLKHLGFLPEITHEKDHLMLELYDRVKQVLPNKGVLMEDIAIREARENVKLECSYMARFGSFSNGFLLGMFAVAVIVIGVEVWVSYHRTPAGKALDNLRSAIIEVQEALK